MAFVNQFQTDVFFEQKIKVLKVVCEVPNVNEFGTVLDVALPAGFTVSNGVILNAAGQPVTLHCVQTVGTSIIPGSLGIIPGIAGKVTNSLIVTLDIVDQFGTVVIAGVTVTVSGIVETGCDLMPDDLVQKHDVQFRGCNVTLSQGFNPAAPTVDVTAIVELCVIIARETILKVNAAELFCR